MSRWNPPCEYTTHELADKLRTGPDLPVVVTIIDSAGHRQRMNADVAMSVEWDGIGALRLVLIGVDPERAHA